MGFLDRFMPEPPSRGMVSGPAPDLTNGIRTTASVEQVVVTGTQESHNATGTSDRVVYIVLRVTDEQGQAGLCERRLLLDGWYIPIPGTIVPVVHLPGQLMQTLDLARNEHRKPVIDDWTVPAPDTPRGWSGGSFGAAGLGSQGEFPLSGHGIEEEREVFRTGRRAEAVVVRAKDSWMTKRESFRRTITLRVEDREIEIKPWTPPQAWPAPGDHIQVAFGDDETKPALDTDERWCGLPGRVLVLTTPPEILAARSPQSLEEQARQAGDALLQQGMTEAKRRQLAALEAARDKGSITDEQLADMKARLGIEP